MASKVRLILQRKSFFSSSYYCLPSLLPPKILTFCLHRLFLLPSHNFHFPLSSAFSSSSSSNPPSAMSPPLPPPPSSFFSFSSPLISTSQLEQFIQMFPSLPLSSSSSSVTSTTAAENLTTSSSSSPPSLVILDASLIPLPNNSHRRPYEEFIEIGHLPRSNFADLDVSLSDFSSPFPHMLPSAAQFAEFLVALLPPSSSSSVSSSSSSTELSEEVEDFERFMEKTYFVVYDSTGIYSSPRLWWMLRFFGFENVSVLDGGFPKWRTEGRKVEKGEGGGGGRMEMMRGKEGGEEKISCSGNDIEEEKKKKKKEEEEERERKMQMRRRKEKLLEELLIKKTKDDLVRNYEDINKIIRFEENDGQFNHSSSPSSSSSSSSSVFSSSFLPLQPLIVDARSSSRFCGEAPEPREGLPSGSIPTSVNVPFSDVLDLHKVVMRSEEKSESGGGGGEGRSVEYTTMKSREELRKVFGMITEEEGGGKGKIYNFNFDEKSGIVCTCGSGITASILLFALHIADIPLERLSLYDGSWTEWKTRRLEEEKEKERTQM